MHSKPKLSVIKYEYYLWYGNVQFYVLQVAVLSYSAKFASNFYGPFR